MARRPRSTASAPMEPRGSIADSRVTFVPIPYARKLMHVCIHEVHLDQLDGAIVWIVPGEGDTPELLERARADFAHHAVAVRVLPGATEAAVLPAEAGEASTLSDVSEVRPVVAELVGELPKALRDDVGDYCDILLSNAGL